MGTRMIFRNRYSLIWIVSLIFTVILVKITLSGASHESIQGITNQPCISFTFDDGSVNDMPGYRLKAWNEMILLALKKNNVKAVFFPAGKFLEGTKGAYVLSSWDKENHRIGNHTFHHPNFNNSQTTLEQFKLELLKNDSVVRRYDNFIPLFRFPYLKEGNSVAKRDGFRNFLKEKSYRIGHVSIDASDWFVNNRLLKALRKDPNTNTDPYRRFYIQHMFERACFYDSLATEITNRKIKHNVLLHHNLTSALFLEDLIEKFKLEGWAIIDAEEAFKDSVYNNLPKNIPAGESLIWAMAKETGEYDSILRYPAEDGRYEKPKMDSLGL
jgi:peptidoglycan/xylan/chitin deacetylase (PgdA/CDA1 family)